MVGVPTSNACVTCRARRKGCDGKRPGCGQCNKRGVVCGGYKKVMKVVLEDPGRKLRKFATANTIVVDLGTPLSDSTSSNTTTLTTSSASSPIILPQSLLETAWRAQCYSTYFDAYPVGGSKQWSKLNTDWSVSSSTGWLQLVAAECTTDSLLNDALTALTMAQLEYVDNHSGMYNSRTLYNRAIRELANRLRTNDPACFSDATLAGVMALTIYELQGGTISRDKTTWLSHVQGASSLIRLRGSRNFESSMAERLYLGAQMNELLKAIGRRKGGGRQPDEWLHLYSPHTDKQSSALQLFEVLHDLPHVIYYADSITLDSAGSDADLATTMQNLAARAQTLELQLLAWYNRLQLQQSNGSKLFWDEPSSLYQQLPEGHSGRVYPDFLCFQDVAIAEQIVLFWTTLLFIPLMIRNTAIRLFFPLNSIPATISNPMELSTKITRSLEYFLHPDMGLTELFFIGFPMNLTLAFLTNVESKALPFYAVIAQRLMEINSGLGDFLAEMLERGGGLQALKMLVS